MNGTQSKGAQAPAMQQYLREKARHPDALLFFRMGDFYELFFDDALTAAKALDLTLTSRNKNEADSIPMCGIPYHAAPAYIPRLLEMGHNVAVCEQLEDPSKAKGIVKRGVVRVLTPALVLDAESLDARSNQFLAAVVPPESGRQWSIAAYDLSTGELFTSEVQDLFGVVGELARLDVRELVCPKEHEAAVRAEVRMLPRLFVRAVAPIGPSEASDVLASAMGDEALHAGFGELPVGTRVAAALALRYAMAFQPGTAVSVQRSARLDAREHLHLDETITAMGARRLRTWLAFPLQDIKRVHRRQDAVEALVVHPELRQGVRESLAMIPDLERLAVRATMKVATPRDLGSLRDGLRRMPALLATLSANAEAAEALGPLRAMDPCAPLCAMLEGSLSDSPPAALEDGGVFRAGFDPELDRYTSLASNAREVILTMETRERTRTRITSLKIKFNGVFGYFIEVTKANLHLVPSDYRRKQTIAGGERFITDELTSLETEILEAEERARELERARYEQLRGKVADAVGKLSKLANQLADLDAIAALAEVAHRHDYTRPIVDDSGVIDLRDARHPVVETMLEPGAFVPNDIKLEQSGARLLLVTGPNMAGKSTLMRQVALVVLMAQAGSFVPARSARVGKVDRIFTRVGASDDVARGASTFMVEMRETATILRGATARSLVLFDEIGRGTSTFDGLAIAWAVAEYLHDAVKARAMFATHYHELCALAETRSHVANVNVSARETGDDIVFLHKLAEGGASRSYGVAVAKIAGLPEPVLLRARAMLKDLERGEGPMKKAPKQIGLFEERPAPVSREHPVIAALEAVELDRMTPMESLHLLAQLKAMIAAK